MYKYFFTRLKVIKIFFTLIFFIFVIRLFELQILKYEEYDSAARSQHEKHSVLPARRGKILVYKKDKSGNTIPLATNSTLQLIFVDPLILNFPEFDSAKPLNEQKRGNPLLAAELLAPLLIQAHCSQIDSCNIAENFEADEQARTAIKMYQKELEEIFTNYEKNKSIIQTDLTLDRIAEVDKLNLIGISTEKNNVIADPTKINDIDYAAEKLSPILGIAEGKIRSALEKKFLRYLVISRKIVPQISQKIIELKQDPKFREILRGIGMTDEHWRYYPEKDLAAATIGFVDSQGEGQYGVEGRFNYELKGKEGSIFGATNLKGQQLFGRWLGIEKAEDGVDIVLSLDRRIQREVQTILKEDLEKYNADNVQALVIKPKTGRILAMVNEPGFDLNDYGEAFSRYEITAEQEEFNRLDEEFNQHIPTIFENNHLYRYFNKWGPDVFRNRVIADLYEPGSVIKVLTMAMAIDAQEVEPKTTFEDDGPVEVDEFLIRNSDDIYAGTTTMIDVLNRSINTGIAFLTRKMGAQMVYEYLLKFGFTQYTDIELNGEARGDLEVWTKWEDSELVTRGFGQGMTANLLQVGLSFCSVINGGNLLKPLFVEEYRYPNGKIEKNEPKIIRRVISEQTSNTLRSMLYSSVQNGIARGARVKGYKIMGKTGTSQTYKNGKVRTGEGTTITSFVGAAPMDNPRFAIIIKYNYPRKSQWGSETAAISFRKIASFLFDYYKIPADK